MYDHIMANFQGNPQDLSPAAASPSPVMQPPANAAAMHIQVSASSPASTALPLTTMTPPSTVSSGIIDGPLSAVMHKGPPPSTPPGGLVVTPRVTPSPKPANMNPRSSPAAGPAKDTPKDTEGQRVIVTTRTPIFVRSYTHAQTTQSSPNQPSAPRMTAASIRPTPTGQVMPTTAGMVQQVRPVSSQVLPMRGHPRSVASVRGGHVNKVRVMPNGPNRATTAQILAQAARAQNRAQGRPPAGLVIREQTPPARSPPHAIRGQQPRIRIPISGTGRGVSSSHSPVLITGTQVRTPFFPHGGTLLTYQPGNPRLQAALSGSHLAGSRVAMTTSGQFVVQAQAKLSPGNGQVSPRLASNQVRHGLISPTRARMPATMPNPISHHKPILPSPGRTVNSHQLLTVAGPQQPHLQHAHRPTAQIRAHLPRISPRPPPGPVQAHSHHHQVSDPSFHSTPDATPMNLVTSPKGSPQLQPVDMSAKSNHSPSSSTIPTPSHSPAPSRTIFKSEGSDSDTSSGNNRFKVTSTATAPSPAIPSLVPQPSHDSNEPMEVQESVPAVIEEPRVVPKETPMAIVKPHILTHVIDGFIIEESKEPFPVTTGILSEANATYKDNARISAQKRQGKAVQYEEGVMLRCEFCGKMDSPHKFKRSKRFCSMSCAKRYNVGCSKRLGLFSPRAPEKPEKTKHKLKLQLKAKPIKGQRGKHGRLTYNVTQPWGRHGQLTAQRDTQGQQPPETSSGSSSSAPSEDLEPPLSSPNVNLSSPGGRSSDDNVSFQYSDESEDLPPGVGRDPGTWSADHVAAFIRSLPGCGDYAEQFLSQEIDGQALMLLKEDHLMTALNMKLGPALKIINKINSLKER